MSDFDKEAERERLREKYGGEPEDREQTQRMSQLLLQGATMTNKHCDACGSPVFRHEGQEFCPECHDAGVEGDADAAVEDRTGAGTDAAAAGGPADTTGTVGDGADGPAATDSRPQGVDDRGAETPATGSGESRRRAGGGEHADPPDDVDVDTDLGEARASLVRTLGTMARRAEATDDPRRATELLAAAREAAEAVAALDR